MLEVHAISIVVAAMVGQHSYRNGLGFLHAASAKKGSVWKNAVLDKEEILQASSMEMIDGGGGPTVGIEAGNDVQSETAEAFDEMGAFYSEGILSGFQEMNQAQAN